MSEELAVRRMDNEQIELVKNTIAKGCTSDELALFIEQCNRTQLDPFARQIYAVSRYDGKLGRPVMQTQVSIDGARLVAQRSGEYAGQTPVWYCGADRQWVDLWLPEDGYPKAAKIGVYRQGFVEPLWATATWEQYVQTTKDGKPNRMWGQMGPLMLGKCAEMLALRKAFPMELSGLYSAEEMGQAANEAPPKADAPKSSKRAPTAETIKRSAPVQESEPASEDDVANLKAILGMLEDEDKAEVKDTWERMGIPPLAHGLSAEQVHDVTEMVAEVLNRVDGEIADGEVVEEHSEDHASGGGLVEHGTIEAPMITNPQIGKIRVLVGNAGVDKDDVHTIVSDIIHRQIGSLKELTKAEASRVIDQLISDAEE